MPVEEKTFGEVEELVGPSCPGGPYTRWREAVVFKGVGGDLQNWLRGITKALTGVLTPEDGWFLITTTGGRQDLVMPLPESNVDLGRMAIWKMNFLEGDCSWWSDYRVNYAKQHGEETPVDEAEVTEAEAE